MLEDPGIDREAIAAGLREHCGIAPASITFLPIGYDPNAAVYEVVAADGRPYFLKIRSGAIHEPGLQVPRALLDHGISQVLAPLRAASGELWAPLGERRLVLYPFLRGENAMNAGLTGEQWRAFGATLRAVHDSGLPECFQGHLPPETFSLPSAEVVRQHLAMLDGARFASPAATRFAAFWREKACQIQAMLARAEALGARLQGKTFEHVLCHADIHAANILVDDAGQIWLVDWDGPLLAPRERDLLFVVGSQIARDVLPWEEEQFFAGYGPVEIDPEALIYYRYERIIQDLGDFGQSVFLSANVGEATREADADLAMRFFAPGSMIEAAETVTLPAASRPAG